MGLRFIFMLTQNDRTTPEAAAHLEIALSLGVRHVGFKDVGLPIADLVGLNDAIKAKGATSYLEVVSLDRDSERASAQAAVDIGVDVLMGGARADDVLPILDGSAVAYYPFPGRIVGHPSVLEGSIDEIATSAKALAARDGVAGLDLLAYRAASADPEALISAVCAAVNKPVIIAGSIRDRARIAAVRDAGAAGFTIGTAALHGRYPAARPDLETQLAAIVRDVAALNGHLSPFSKQNLDRAYSDVRDAETSKSLGRVDDLEFGLFRQVGVSSWRFHQQGDYLFFIHRGRLLMRFRDREEVIEQGEFIVVPRGVEHSLVALTEECAVLRAAAGA